MQGKWEQILIYLSTRLQFSVRHWINSSHSFYFCCCFKFTNVCCSCSCQRLQISQGSFHFICWMCSVLSTNTTALTVCLPALSAVAPIIVLDPWWAVLICVVRKTYYYILLNLSLLCLLSLVCHPWPSQVFLSYFSILI